MEFMKGLPDNAFDLAIVDPPYGIGCAKTINIKNSRRGFSGKKLHEAKGWDAAIPDRGYFSEIMRVTVDQIIWGGNYFTEFLPSTKAWVFWNKKETKEQGSNFSDGELAWTSLNKVTRLFEYGWIGIDYCNKKEKKQHPTQKPVALYKWLLQNYAKPGQTIFDSHVGSGSIRIACHDLGFDFEGCEIDEDYHAAQEERYRTHAAQGALFDPVELTETYHQKDLIDPS